MLCHLGAHSYFSLLEGISSPGELAAEAARYEMPGLFITDHTWLTGAVEFWQAAAEQGIKPGLGLDLEISIGRIHGRLTLLAESRVGWSNLCRLSSEKMLDGAGSTPLPWDRLREHSEGLILILPGNNLGRSLAEECRTAFSDRVMAGITVDIPADIPDQLEWAGFAERQKIPAVAFHPSWYCRQDQAVQQRLVSSIRLNKPVGRLSPEECAPKSGWFLSPAEMKQRYRDFPGAIERTLLLLDRCDADLPLGQAWYPVLDIPDGLSAADFLRREAEAGARRSYGAVTPEVRKRLDHELGIIQERGYEPIFLIVKELLDFARQQDIPTASRGSASSSLVAHCLGITTPDPISLDLYFERFLNPARRSPPDIDTDICSAGRDKVIQHAFNRFGQDKVAMVATINRFRPRSALGEAAKANGLNSGEIRELSAKLPHSFWARMETPEDESGDTPGVFQQALQAHPQHKALFAQAAALLGSPRHLSIHPGGLVVCPAAVTDRVPLMRSESKDIRVTQMDLHSVEALGLVKIDLLGIRGLSVMGDVARSIYSWRRSEYRNALSVLDRIPESDEATADTVERGQTVGCFQIESPGMRGTLREVNARSPRDILAALALYRPGPLQGGLRDAFVRRYKGLEDAVQLHPSLEPLLAETYGVILYQEQVLRIANEIAGLNLAEADLLRRAMSHFDPGRQMAELRVKFIRGAEAHRGVPEDVAARLWELMAAFAGYGFPKAHAASYAVVGWRSAWCKTHFPAEFMAAVLANWGGYYSQSVYLSEARRLKLNVMGPDIQHSRSQFSVAYPKGESVLYMGLGQVKHLTEKTQQAIYRFRPFNSLSEFILRADPQTKELTNLIRCGALRSLGSIPQLLGRAESTSWRSGQPGLFESEPEAETGDDWSLLQKSQAEMEILGTSVSVHPLDLVRDQLPENLTSSSIAYSMVGKRVAVAGVRMTYRRRKSSKGGMLLFLTIEDMDGTLDCVLFPDAYRRWGQRLDLSKPMILEGIMEEDAERPDPILRVERAVNVG